MLCKPQILFLREHILSILGIAPPPVFYIGGSDTLPPPLPAPTRSARYAARRRGDEEAKKAPH